MSTMEELFSQAQNLPNIPKVVQELIETFEQTDVNADEITRKISMDQALSAKVLRLANTAHYGGTRNIASVKDAVIMLGFNTLRTLVLASGFVSAFKPPQGFDLKGFWKHSFQTAALSKWLARYCKQDSEVAFTCGLLHDVGSLLIHICKPEQSVSIDNSVALGGNRVQLENTLLGYNFCEVGAELANRWKFPLSIVQGIAHQQDPLAAQPLPPLAGIIYLAQYIIHARMTGATLAQMEANFPQPVSKALGIDMAKLAEHLEEIESLDIDIDSFLS